MSNNSFRKKIEKRDNKREHSRVYYWRALTKFWLKTRVRRREKEVVLNNKLNRRANFRDINKDRGS